MFVKRLYVMMFAALCIFAQTALAQKTPAPGTNITVSKSGGMFDKIQDAVNAARPGQIIEILDEGLYVEQVTIDGRVGGSGATEHPWGQGVVGGKYGITIRYVPAPGVNERPVIRWQDTQNRSPRNSTEAAAGLGGPYNAPGTAGNYTANGALRILSTSGITIEGVIVDGGGSAPFLWPGVWGVWPLTHGNAAITISMSGNVQIRDCELRNAFYGIYVSGRNTGGIFANSNTHDNDYVVPLSGFGKDGNHLIEYNKIGDNEVGIFFNEVWDLGSTVRYNLIYGNYPRSALTTTRGNDAGLAACGIKFKDHYLSPIAIYNNTFFDNYANLMGDWQVGYQHLIFNNIFSRPRALDLGIEFIPFSERFIESKFPNRMKHCVFVNTPVPTGIPAEANVNTVNMPASSFFQSVISSDSNFLVPRWNIVDNSVRNRGWGWPSSGIILNEDGTIADLGAIPFSGKRPCDGRAQTSRARIIPTNTVTVTGTQAAVSFNITQEIGSIDNLNIKYIRWIAPIPDNARIPNTMGGFRESNGNDGIAVPPEAIQLIDPAGISLVPGLNRVTFTLPRELTDEDEYGFFELVVEGRDGIGRIITADVGFLPYRSRKGHYLDIHVIGTDGNQVSNPVVTAGEPVTIRVTAMSGNDPFTMNNNELPFQVQYNLLSNPSARMRHSVNDNPLEFESDLKTSGAYTKTYTVYFTRAGSEVVSAAGLWCDGNCNNEFIPRISFLGGLHLTVLPASVEPDFPPDVVFLTPVSISHGVSPPILNGFYSVEVLVRDIFGNGVSTAVDVTLASGNPALGFVMSAPTVSTDPATGIAYFIVQANEDELSGGEFELFASINHNGTIISDIARLRVEAREIVGPRRPQIVTGEYVAGSGDWIHAAQLTFDENVADNWFSSMEFAFGPLSRGTMTNLNCVLPVAGDPRSVIAIFGCAFHRTDIKPGDVANSRITVNFNALNGWAPQTLSFANGEFVSILAPNRVIPKPPADEDSIAVPLTAALSAEFTAGPNPLSKQSGVINFFWQGKRIQSASLRIFDASGNVVNRKIPISDRRGVAFDKLRQRDSQSVAEPVEATSRRQVGSWNLTDGKGRLVSEGTYLVRGVIITSDGKRERVSVMIGVR